MCSLKPSTLRICLTYLEVDERRSRGWLRGNHFHGRRWVAPNGLDVHTPLVQANHIGTNRRSLLTTQTRVCETNKKNLLTTSQGFVLC